MVGLATGAVRAELDQSGEEGEAFERVDPVRSVKDLDPGHSADAKARSVSTI